MFLRTAVEQPRMADDKVSMKLLIDTKRKQVLFAEAGKDCVDFLFHILSLPVGTVIRLLEGQETVGCLPNLYESLENLDESYLQSKQNKQTILKPLLPANHAPASVPNLLLLTSDNYKATERLFYSCGSCYSNVLYDDPKSCPTCCRMMNKTMKYTAPAVAKGVNEGGFVKGMVTYMVMDDLEVTPMSTISGITLLNKLNVKELGSLQEKVVTLGMDEAVKLLKTSLQSKKVLTEVFLKGLAAPPHKTVNMLDAMKWSGQERYLAASTVPFSVDGAVAGLQKGYRPLF